MPSVAIYLRLSEEDRDKSDENQDSESIMNQRSMLVEYANSHNWEIFDIYSDEDYSGSDSKRPAFNRMINDARDRKFQVLLCKSLSRFARDVSMVETYINGHFIEWGIRFISVSDYADSAQKGSRKNIQINSLVNQWYLEDLSENIKSVMNHKKRQGQFVGSFAPYGYIKDPNDTHRLIVDEEAAKVVRRIFNLYLDGYGLKAIGNILNQEYIPCPSVYRCINGIKTNRKNAVNESTLWSDITLSHILENPTYTGNLVQGRFGKPTYKSKSSKRKNEEEWIVVENAHGAIISSQDFKRVQEIRKEKGLRNRGSNSSTRNPNIFAGLIKCKICGHALTLSGGGYKGGTPYLRCTGRKSGVASCTCAMVKYSEMIEKVTAHVRKLIDTYCDYALLEKQSAKKDDYYTSEIANLQRSIAKNKLEQERADKALSDAYIDKSDGILSADEFLTISLNLRQKKSDLVESFKSITARLNELIELKNSQEKTTQMITKYQNFQELTRKMLADLVSVIYVGERYKEINDYAIEIEWNF